MVADEAGMGASLDDMVQEAGFIFIGTVQRLQATMIDAITERDRTAIVRVEALMKSPDSLRLYEGRELTLMQREPGRLAIGQRAVFFTTGWMYGTSVAVREVGTREPEGDDAVVRAEIWAAIEKLADADLQRRLRGANLILRARVGRVTPLRGAETSRSEHDPKWFEASLEGERVERGEVPDRPIVVFFPESNDPPWRSAPKFRAGQEGIWILRETDLESVDREGYTALNPLDFQSVEKLNRISRLLAHD
jgi:hypothetical protein